jgi:predicted nucleic acid-binding protein
MIVADASLVVYLLLPGEHTAAARGWRAREPVWLLPRSWRSDVRNTLLGYFQSGQLQLVRAQELMDLAERALWRGERGVDSSRVLELAVSSGVSAYDCEYVALAEAAGVPLVTGNHRLREAFPQVTVLFHS